MAKKKGVMPQPPKKVRVVKTGFGDAYEFPYITAPLIIVFVTGSRGRVPMRILLPHQLYVEDVKEMLEEVDEPVAYVQVCPVHSTAFIRVCDADVVRLHRRRKLR